MSRTDKTKPAKVQIAEQAIAVHDHSKGECDLTSLEEWCKIPLRKQWSYSCRWEPKSWHRVHFSRTAGHKDYLANKRKHKYPDWKN